MDTDPKVLLEFMRNLAVSGLPLAGTVEEIQPKPWRMSKHFLGYRVKWFTLREYPGFRFYTISTPRSRLKWKAWGPGRRVDMLIGRREKLPKGMPYGEGPPVADIRKYDDAYHVWVEEVLPVKAKRPRR